MILMCVVCVVCKYQTITKAPGDVCNYLRCHKVPFWRPDIYRATVLQSQWHIFGSHYPSISNSKQLVDFSIDILWIFYRITFWCVWFECLWWTILSTCKGFSKLTVPGLRYCFQLLLVPNIGFYTNISQNKKAKIIPLPS